MELDYATPTPIDPVITFGGFCLFTVLCGVFGFLVFITFDVILVRFAPSHVTDYDWTAIGFPIAVGGAGLYRYRRLHPGGRIALALLAVLLASAMVVVLMVCPGIAIHVAVGGEL